MTVFDASALLAFVQGEDGADLVEAALAEGGTCSAANWSEVAQKVVANERDWDLVRSLLLAYPLTVEPVTAHDGEAAARLGTDAPSLSLGDRLCLALADRLGAEVLTADSAWGSGDRIRQIR